MYRVRNEDGGEAFFDGQETLNSEGKGDLSFPLTSQPGKLSQRLTTGRVSRELPTKARLSGFRIP